jgi:hypothetical protein
MRSHFELNSIFFASNSYSSSGSYGGRVGDFVTPSTSGLGARKASFHDSGRHLSAWCSHSNWRMSDGPAEVQIVEFEQEHKLVLSRLEIGARGVPIIGSQSEVFLGRLRKPNIGDRIAVWLDECLGLAESEKVRCHRRLTIALEEIERLGNQLANLVDENQRLQQLLMDAQMDPGLARTALTSVSQARFGRRRMWIGTAIANLSAVVVAIAAVVAAYSTTHGQIPEVTSVSREVHVACNSAQIVIEQTPIGYFADDDQTFAG